MRPGNQSPDNRSAAPDRRDLRVTPGAIDLRLAARPVAPGADSAPVEFTSPLGTVTIDRVDMVGDRVKLARNRVKVPSTISPETAYETEQVEIAVPLELLGWDPRSLPRTTGDIGVFVGRDGETVERAAPLEHIAERSLARLRPHPHLHRLTVRGERLKPQAPIPVRIDGRVRGAFSNRDRPLP